MVALKSVAVFNAAHEAFHFLGQVVEIDLGGVVGTVADIGPQDLGLAVLTVSLAPRQSSPVRWATAARSSTFTSVSWASKRRL